jgi:hypothetical protein
MSGFIAAWPIFWAQVQTNVPAVPPGPVPGSAIPREQLIRLMWLFLASDPWFSTNDILGGILTWFKVVGLVCLVCWIGSWLVSGVKLGVIGRGRWYDYLGWAALILTPITVMLRVMEQAKRLDVYQFRGINLTTAVTVICIACYVIWAEIGLAKTLAKYGRRLDGWVLFAIHAALAAGIGIGFYLVQAGYLALIVPTMNAAGQKVRELTWRDGLIYGARIGATYMGYVVFLRVLVLLIPEVVAIRWRRLFSIALLAVRESNRRMWAPWVVTAVFLLILAFTHWFIQPPRLAEMGRLYVGSLSFMCSLLLTVMVTIMTPLSLPMDIQNQTIFTVVSKPVRRLELIWGRMIGYMALVTVLVLVFGGISLFYLRSTVGAELENTQLAAEKAKKENRVGEYKALMEQADQLRTRMQARVPIRGELHFLDSRGTPHRFGIDTGGEQSTLREPRSHIEGATQSAAIWSFGVPSPFTPPGRPMVPIPLEDFLRPGTAEWHLDRAYTLMGQIDAAKAEKNQANVTASRVSQLDAAITRNQTELEQEREKFNDLTKRKDDLRAKAVQLEKEGKKKEAAAALQESAKLSSPPVHLEMTFNVYRTTKGKVGEPVFAEVEAVNPVTRRQFDGDVFAIKEYYTNKVQIPAWILAGSRGTLRVQIRCLSATQYLGMAESDLYLLASSGGFGANFMKGLFGIWLQAMVLTAIGVFAGTFLSWPVAFLVTLFFLIGGQLAFSFLVDFSRQAVMGGGPVESLIRILTHDNQMTDLTPTAGVLLAKTFDSLVMPLMSMIVYVVPNFQALDVSNLVSNGFMVKWHDVLVHTLLALAYAVPFSFAGYLILKNREVAA